MRYFSTSWKHVERNTKWSPRERSRSVSWLAVMSGIGCCDVRQDLLSPKWGRKSERVGMLGACTVDCSSVGCLVLRLSGKTPSVFWKVKEDSIYGSVSQKNRAYVSGISCLIKHKVGSMHKCVSHYSHGENEVYSQRHFLKFVISDSKTVQWCKDVSFLKPCERRFKPKEMLWFVTWP